jgi:hypothetical protein
VRNEGQITQRLPMKRAMIPARILIQLSLVAACSAGLATGQLGPGCVVSVLNRACECRW